MANDGGGNVSVLINCLPHSGQVCLDAAVNYAAGTDPLSVFAADLDGDGDQDLAVANRLSDASRC